MLSACVTSVAEPPGAAMAERGVRLLARQEDADALYRQAATLARSWQCWSNLSALALGLGRFEEALAHARRAISLAPRMPQPWINAAVASWRMGVRKDAAKAMHHAIQIDPRNTTAAVNYALMLRAANRPNDAHDVLANTLANGASSFPLHRAMAELTRILEQPSQARTHILAALTHAVEMPIEWSDVPAKAASKVELPDAATWRAVLVDCLQRLQPLSAEACLVGGAVRMFALHDGLPEARKDVDIAIRADVSRDALLAAFASGYRPYARQGQRVPDAGRMGVLGLVHEASEIPVDIMLQLRDGGRWRGSFGPPDYLTFDTPAFAVGEVLCTDVEVLLPMPQPMGDYLYWIYGEDWRQDVQQVAGRVIPRDYLQKGLLSPGLDPASQAIAVTRALMSLASSIAHGHRVAARALCDQVLAVESIEPVHLIRARLL